MEKITAVVLMGVFLAYSKSLPDFKDEDLDGVEDSKDRCPGTPFLMLVDENGCPIEKVRPRFYLRYGMSYSQENGRDTLLSLVTMAVSYKRFYISGTGRYYHRYDGLGNGLGDSTLYGSYTFRFESLYLVPGVRLRLPTGDRRFTDGYTDVTFSAVADLFLNGFDLVFFGSYTLKGNPALRNTYTLSAGPGYYFNDRFYGSVSYDMVSSAVRDRVNQYLSLFALLDISGPLYSTLSYSYGLTPQAVDHTVTLRIALRF